LTNHQGQPIKRGIPQTRKKNKKKKGHNKNPRGGGESNPGVKTLPYFKREKQGLWLCFFPGFWGTGVATGGKKKKGGVAPHEKKKKSKPKRGGGGGGGLNTQTHKGEGKPGVTQSKGGCNPAAKTKKRRKKPQKKKSRKTVVGVQTAGGPSKPIRPPFGENLFPPTQKFKTHKRNVNTGGGGGGGTPGLGLLQGGQKGEMPQTKQKGGGRGVNGVGKKKTSQNKQKERKQFLGKG